MAYHANQRRSSILDGFTLNPLPYPVLLILALILVFLGFQWSSDAEEVMESAEESTNWALLLSPVILIIIVRCLSSIERPGWLLGLSPYDRRRQLLRQASSEGGSPWAVLAVIILLLVLVQYQSLFRDSWFL